MSLTYLSGIGASRAQKKQAKAQTIQARGQVQQARQANRQALVKQSAPVKILKAVAKQSPTAAAKIKKAAVQAKQRKAFKKAGEPLKISPETLQAESTYELPLKITEGVEEVNEPEFTDETTGGENDPETAEDMGIIYPQMSGTKSKKAPKSKTAPKTKAPLTPAQKENIKKASTAVLNVAKATLEAKGVKFPTKEQVQTEAQQIAPPAPKTNYTPFLIGGGLLAAFLIFKK